MMKMILTVNYAATDFKLFVTFEIKCAPAQYILTVWELITVQTELQIHSL